MLVRDLRAVDRDLVAVEHEPAVDAAPVEDRLASAAERLQLLEAVRDLEQPAAAGEREVWKSVRMP